MPDSPGQMPRYALLESLVAQKRLCLKGIYRIKDVAEIFGVSVRTIQDWCSDGRLVSRNLPGRARCLSADLEEFLQGSLKGPKNIAGQTYSPSENARERISKRRQQSRAKGK